MIPIFDIDILHSYVYDSKSPETTLWIDILSKKKKNFVD